MPTRVRFFHAVHDVDDADDSAEFEVLGNIYAVFVFYTTQVGFKRGDCGARVNSAYGFWGTAETG